MARVDDYQEARRMAVDLLAADSLDAICERSGVGRDGAASIRVLFLDRRYQVGYPDFQFRDVDDPGREIPLQEQVLILHYLTGEGVRAISGQWIAYREIPGATFYYGAFVKRAIDPLKKAFGDRLEDFSAAVEKMGGRAIDAGDAGAEISALPRVPVQLVLHRGDAEFPAEAGILFDASVDRYLSPEDAAWLAGMVVYRLIAIAR
ncbi:MAG: DUF3786 domain-containing protein [Desulfobacterales bacterium]